MKFLIYIVISSIYSCLDPSFTLGEIKGQFSSTGMDISALSCINSEICLAASDEENKLQFFSIKNHRIIVKNQFISLGDFKYENDIETLTNDGSSLYAIGSHSLSRKKRKFKPERYLLFKISLNKDLSI